MRLLSRLLVRLRLLSQPLHGRRDDARPNTIFQLQGFGRTLFLLWLLFFVASRVLPPQRWILSIVLVVADLRETAARKNLMRP